MVLFLGRRVAALAATLLVASLIIYGAQYLTPGDPAALLAGGHNPSQATLQAIRAEYHLNDPFLEQYWLWLSGVLTWHLGRAIAFDDTVADLIGTRLANTAFLVVYAALLIIVIGVALGVTAALRGPAARNAITGATGLLMAVPTFIAAVVLIWLFATKLNWFPVFGSGVGFADQLRHMTLPAVALACSYIAYLSQVTRSAVTEQLRAEHVITARLRGLGTARIVRRHVLRNAAAPVLAISGLTVAGLIAGTVVAEQAFGISGIGSLLVLAAEKRDFLVVQDIALLMVAAFVVINTIVDLISGSLDPRLAKGGAR